MKQHTVSYPMYAAAPGATRGFWQGLRQHLQQAGLDGVDAELADPDDLMRHWQEPALLLSQTCGYPLTHALAKSVQIVGTPCYDAPGCDGPLYSSVFVVRKNETAENLEALRGKRVAFNSTDSQSGYNSLRSAIAPLARAGRFFTAAIESGAHRRSLELVQAEDADIAAVDCVTYALAGDAGLTKGLRILGFSQRVPGLPLVTAASASPETVRRLQEAFSAACADPALAGFRSAMRLSGFDVMPLSAYDGILAMEDEAIAAGYPELA